MYIVTNNLNLIMKRILLLSLLMQMLTGWAFVRAQDLKFRVVEFYQDQQDLSGQEENRDDGDGALYAVIKVTSDNEDDDLSQFLFDFNNQRNTREMRDGELWLFVQRNAKYVTIRREGYRTLKNAALGLTVQPGKTYRLKLSVQERIIQQRILQFKVSPANEGAIVKVKKEDSNEDYQLWGAVDAQGSIDRLLDMGEYLYEISAEGYKTAQGKVSLTSGEGNYIEKVSLTANFGFLEIPDEHGIAGAEVYVNNRKVGTIPYKSGRMECRSDYQLMISNGELYKTYNSTIEIRQGETTKLSPRLQSNFAETTIKVQDEAEIFLNGTSKGKGSWTGSLRAGTYNVECRLPNHVSSQKQIVVKPDEAETFVIEKPKPIEGSLYVKSNPSGAKIHLDGKNLGITTPAKIDHVLIGSHKVTIMMDNHKPENIDINVKQDETATVDVKLSNMALMTIKSSPSGAELYIDGKYKGTTPYSEEMASGDYDVKLLKKKCRTLTRRVHLDSANPEQTFSLSRQYQQSSQFYLQPMAQVGTHMGAGAAMGCFISNFNVEADFIYGFKKEPVYWNDPTPSPIRPIEESYSNMYFGGKLGWGFIIGTRMRVTPQIGGGVLKVAGSESSCYAIRGSVGVRADYVLANHIGLVLAPEYCLPFSKSSVYDAVSAVSSTVKGWGSGFNCSLGLNIFF